MFNFGGCCGDSCSCGCGGGSELWSCLLNLIIIFIVLEFLCSIITGGNGLACGAGCNNGCGNNCGNNCGNACGNLCGCGTGCNNCGC